MKNAIISALLCYEYYRICVVKSLAVTMILFFVLIVVLYEFDDIFRKGQKWVKENLRK